jgi:hypothetical protein
VVALAILAHLPACKDREIRDGGACRTQRRVAGRMTFGESFARATDLTPPTRNACLLNLRLNRLRQLLWLFFGMCDLDGKPQL